MGSLLCRREYKDAIEWAQCFFWEKLMMVLNVPSAAEKIICWWHLIGPALLLWEVSDGYQWAQCHSQKKLPIVFQCCSHKYMTIALYGPSIAHKRICQQFWIGLASSQCLVMDYVTDRPSQWQEYLMTHTPADVGQKSGPSEMNIRPELNGTWVSVIGWTCRNEKQSFQH